MNTKTKIDAIKLNWDEKKRQIVVTPEDNDKFVVTVGEAIEACKATKSDKSYENYKKFADQFDVLLDTLWLWIQDHKQDVFKAYLTIRDSDLLFLPIKISCNYDDDFEDELTELDITIAQNSGLDLIRLSVLALPKSSDNALSSFVHPEHPSLVYHNA